ncbi:MAG: hypothetical protein HWD89_10305 [Tenacibaculum sp.]|uniref:putative phage abortive infection protein n=1 Tax=Tenacibaculum sp. TaxID=1906242 RepID=UPI0018294837|nr:putative phage abortive infection protein [Tenacibaculum sp.]NVK09437.1 hypothetical protein [Tenacibaculum sp.]
MEDIESIYQELEIKRNQLEPKVSELDTKIDTYTKWAWGFVIFGFIVAAFGVICYLFPQIDGNLTLNELGDYFAGTVASSWSLAGLFFIYVAFIGQKQQLLNQQIEIIHSQVEVKATRFELQGQKEQLIEQNKTAKFQRFENTFFALLNNHTSMVNDIDIRKKDINSGGYSVSAQGRDCFKVFYTRFTKECNESSIKSKLMPISETVECYMKSYHQNQADLGHYFRNLYHTLKLIKEEDIIENKKRYSNLLRAQLSSYELALLFYNCLGEYGREKFYPLIEDFDFLKNIDRDLLINQDHISEYPSLNN